MNMYFIAIVLPAVLNERIQRFKNLMLEKYGCRVGLKSPAHITLIPPFWMEEEKEQSLINDTEVISSSIQSFQISTNNFSAFKPKTIFIATTPNKELNEVKNQTDQFFSDNPNYKIMTDIMSFHPHITIATRDLHKKAFHEAWPLFAEKKFMEEWTATGISVLRHNKKNWDVIHTSQFKDL